MTAPVGSAVDDLQILVQYELVAALQEREHDLAEAQRLAGMGSWSWDLSTGVVTWSDELYRIFGVEVGAFRPSFEGFLSLVHVDDREAVEETIRASERSGRPFGIEFRINQSGEERWLRSRGNVVTDRSGGALRMHGTAQVMGAPPAVTPSLERESGVGKDPLTGLADHALLVEHARRALARASRQQWVTAVLIVDIDQFSDINDEFGVDAGDEVLVHVAARLTDAFRASTSVVRAGRGTDTVARFGGDRFAIVCENVPDATVAAMLAARTAHVLRAPTIVSDGRRIELSVGIGVGIAGADGPNLEQRILDAESALRRAKQRGRGQCEVLANGATTRRHHHRNEAERGLRRAFEEGELVVHYQPKVSLESCRVTGAEALLRWADPEHGLVPPLEFVPLAEETGLIVPIGAWVLAEACRQAAAWQQRFPRCPSLTIAVNVSSCQLTSELSTTVSSILARTGVEAAQLSLEVTESVLLGDTEAAVTALGDLAALGVNLSIDDFGTGYSSLAYLKQLPLHELKVDKSFVDDLGEDPDDTAIVSATIAMAHALGLSVVAEGVETVEQLERLRVLGCQEVQGHHISRPLPADAFARFLAIERVADWRAVESTTATEPAEGYRPERILVVDDSADMRQLAVMTLGAVGFEVRDTTGGAQSIETARRFAPDCVILDLQLRDTSGFDLCDALRADPTTARCTIVVLTSNAATIDKIEAFSHGADDYIIKPFSPRDLVSRVRAAMQRRIAEDSSPADGPGSRPRIE